MWLSAIFIVHPRNFDAMRDYKGRQISKLVSVNYACSFFLLVIAFDWKNGFSSSCSQF
jgi:hypothetical protein